MTAGVEYARGLRQGEAIWVMSDPRHPVVRRVESTEYVPGGYLVIHYSAAPDSPVVGRWVVGIDEMVRLASGWDEPRRMNVRSRMMWRSLPWFAGMAALGAVGWAVQAPPASGASFGVVALFICGAIAVVTTPDDER